MREIGVARDPVDDQRVHAAGVVRLGDELGRAPDREAAVHRGGEGAPVRRQRHVDGVLQNRKEGIEQMRNDPRLCNESPREEPPFPHPFQKVVGLDRLEGAPAAEAPARRLAEGDLPEAVDDGRRHRRFRLGGLGRDGLGRLEHLRRLGLAVDLRGLGVVGVVLRGLVRLEGLARLGRLVGLAPDGRLPLGGRGELVRLRGHTRTEREL